LFGGEDDPVGALDLVEPLPIDRRSLRVAPALDKSQRRPLDRDQLGGRVAGRPARAPRLADPLDAVRPCEPCCERANAIG